LKDLEGKVAVVHGNTLTTAIVWDALRRRLPPNSSVVLTGSTAKIGVALVKLLIEDGHTVRAVTTDAVRFQMLRASLADAGLDPSHLQRLMHPSEGKDSAFWVLGKSASLKDISCMGAHSTVFEYAVPRIDETHIGKFKSYQVIGAMSYQEKNTDLTFCHDVRETVPSCLAATIIHTLEGHTEHEVSDVPADRALMEHWLALAQKHGFSSTVESHCADIYEQLEQPTEDMILDPVDSGSVVDLLALAEPHVDVRAHILNERRYGHNAGLIKHHGSRLVLRGHRTSPRHYTETKVARSPPRRSRSPIRHSRLHVNAL